MNLNVDKKVIMEFCSDMNFGWEFNRLYSYLDTNFKWQPKVRKIHCEDILSEFFKIFGLGQIEISYTNQSKFKLLKYCCLCFVEKSILPTFYELVHKSNELRSKETDLETLFLKFVSGANNLLIIETNKCAGWETHILSAIAHPYDDLSPEDKQNAERYARVLERELTKYFQKRVKSLL